MTALLASAGAKLDAAYALHLNGRGGEIGRFRDRRLRHLVRHAYEHVPYYREIFDRHGVRPEHVRGVGDLHRLPVSSKRDLQSRPSDALVARVPGRDSERDLIVRRTTGSTGEPLSIRRTWSEERLLGAFRWRALHALGARVTDRFAEIEEAIPPHPADSRWLHLLLQQAGLYRQRRFDALQPPAALLAELRDWKPDVVSGYAQVLAHVARSALDESGRRPEGVPACGFRPRLVVTHSDVLSASMRTLVASAFGAPVREVYDCNELNLVAVQCPAGEGLHVVEDAAVVEVIVGDRPARPGERGEVVVTALHSLAMPFLRYRLGDVVTQGDTLCACGRAAATIRAVQGRSFDYFPLPDGRMLHPYEIINVLDRSAPWLVHYRLLQERVDLVSLSVVARRTLASHEIGAVHAPISRLLGPRVELRIEQIDVAPEEAGLKPRVCRSLVGMP